MLPVRTMYNDPLLVPLTKSITAKPKPTFSLVLLVRVPFADRFKMPKVALGGMSNSSVDVGSDGSVSHNP